MRGIARVLFLAVAVVICGGSGFRAKGGGSSGTVGIKYPYRFAIVQGIHPGWGFGGSGSNKNWIGLRALCDTLNTLKATSTGLDFLIVGGDNAVDLLKRDGTGPATTDSLNATLINRANFTIHWGLGNHEAWYPDTVNVGSSSPYASVPTCFPALGTNGYYYVDHKNLRLVFINNCVGYDAAHTDYLVNNPGNSEVPYKDWAGIHSSSGTERGWLRNSVLRGRDKSHWLWFFQNRSIYGSDLNHATRPNYNAGRGARYVKEIEDSLATGERAMMGSEDQHWLYLTGGVRDSGVAAATAKGIHHFGMPSGSGWRMADTTEVLGGGSTKLLAFTYYDTTAAARLRGRTTESWPDTLSTAGDAQVRFGFIWALVTVYGDVAQVEFFRVWYPGSSGCNKYTGARTHRLWSKHTISRDVG